jgi:hypothetical protein
LEKEQNIEKMPSANIRFGATAAISRRTGGRFRKFSARRKGGAAAADAKPRGVSSNAASVVEIDVPKKGTTRKCTGKPFRNVCTTRKTEKLFEKFHFFARVNSFLIIFAPVILNISKKNEISYLLG